MLLCDIGNTYFHFFYRGRIWKEEPNLLSRKNEEYRIYYISVNERNEKKLLESHNNCLNIDRFLSLDTIYRGLGIDRIAACFGIKNGIIIDAGSAITIDVMQEGIHLGGYILPGIESYRRLFANIDVLNVEFNLNVSLDTMPQNTRDAVSYGCLKGIILSIKDIAKDNFIYFTGGDGKFLSRFFDNSVYDNTLVFKGMTKAVNDNNLIV
ncbi:type III pantothenate kinase [Helicobacter sp. MIT 14-3879]|uniref:type III pantothenate kinase n=1 Tax=Helicobacter sp. MIT 14-3879 TaxID=2040649 RepID=UPI000E1F2D94|nr:type III pantothenate kinase [Helicobacter sp. MIT 14-3879]RDU64807.1 pantothenate kinase [Helicobacter sp. MIT 14-3879]